MPGADFVVLTLEGADPNGENKSIDECVAIAKEVADAITAPLAIEGCKNAEKDAELFSKIADALQGKNVLFISAKEEQDLLTDRKFPQSPQLTLTLQSS